MRSGVALGFLAVGALAAAVAIGVVVDDAPTCEHPRGVDGGIGHGPDACTFAARFDTCADAEARLQRLRDVELVDGWTCEPDCAACTIRATVVGGDLSAVRAALDAPITDGGP